MITTHAPQRPRAARSVVHIPAAERRHVHFGRCLRDQRLCRLPRRVERGTRTGRLRAGARSADRRGHCRRKAVTRRATPKPRSTLDTAAHETVEAITDPEGVGWMDPNGLEVGDKCENGPQEGTPLGFAANGSPYNQVINGHQYLIQGMWSNAGNGCVQSAAPSSASSSLAIVRMKQFSSVRQRQHRHPQTRGAGRGGARAHRLPDRGRHGPHRRRRRLGRVAAGTGLRGRSRRWRRSRRDPGRLWRPRSEAGSDRDRRWGRPIHRGGLDRLVRPRHRVRGRHSRDRGWPVLADGRAAA